MISIRTNSRTHTRTRTRTRTYRGAVLGGGPSPGAARHPFLAGEGRSLALWCSVVGGVVVAMVAMRFTRGVIRFGVVA